MSAARERRGGHARVRTWEVGAMEKKWREASNRHVVKQMDKKKEKEAKGKGNTEEEDEVQTERLK